jgi:hypothetical protein
MAPPFDYHAYQFVEHAVHAVEGHQVAHQAPEQFFLGDAGDLLGARVGLFDQEIDDPAFFVEHAAQHEEGVQAGFRRRRIGFLGPPFAAARLGQLPRPGADHADNGDQQGAAGQRRRHVVAAVLFELRHLLALGQADHGGQREAVQAAHAGVAHHAVGCGGARIDGVLAHALERHLLAPRDLVADAQGARHAVGADQADQSQLAFARALVGAGEIARIDGDDGDAGEMAGGVVDAAREVQVRLRVGGVAEGPADVGQGAVAVAVHREMGLARHVQPPHGWIAGDDRAVAVRDADHVHQRRRQQALAAQGVERARRAVLFDRVLEHLQGLVDSVQVARHLRLVGVDLFAGGVARGRHRGFAFDGDEVEGRDPDRHQRQQREQRQRDVGLERAPQPAGPARPGAEGAGRAACVIAPPAPAARWRRARRVRYSRSVRDCRRPGAARRRCRGPRRAAGRGR